MLLFKKLLWKYHIQQRQMSITDFEPHKKYLKVLMKWKWWGNFTPFALFLWTLKYILSSSYRRLFLLSFKATIYIFGFKKKMNAKYLKLFWFQVFRPLTGSPSSKYVVYATAYEYRELYVKITDGKKNNNERYEIIVSSTCFI